MRLQILLLLAVAIGVSGCDREASIAFIFPNGYYGLAHIKEDKANGVEMRLLDGVYTIEVPVDGKLAVNSLEPFYQWHKTVARYKSGKTIVFEEFANNDADFLFGLPAVPGLGIFFFLGTKQDYEAVSKLPDFYKLPLARRPDASTLK
jgi:hypothetical protein